MTTSLRQLHHALGHDLKRGADTRTVGTIETMPSALLDEFEKAVEVYANTDEVVRP